MSNERLFITQLAALLLLFGQAAYPTFATADGNESARVLAEFAQGDEVSDIVAVDDKKKQIVMFSMGITLLLLLLTTVFFGVSMAIYGKRVFVQHMICAGLSVTLAIAHVVVALVWFFPF